MTNFEILEIVLSSLSLLVSSILTIYVIYQNNKLNKKQQDLEVEIAEKTFEINERSIKQNQIQKREDVFNLIFDIYEYCEMITIILDKKKNYKQYSDFFQEVHNLKINLFEYYNVKLLIGENYVGKHVAPTIVKIRKLFLEMQEKINLFAIGFLLTDKEQLDVCNNMPYIKKLCVEILKTKFYICSVLKEELRI